MPEPRWSLIEHAREQIARDPESYANAAKLRVVARKMMGVLGGDEDESENCRSVREVPAVE